MDSYAVFLGSADMDIIPRVKVLSAAGSEVLGRRLGRFRFFLLILYLIMVCRDVCGLVVCAIIVDTDLFMSGLSGDDGAGVYV